MERDEDDAKMEAEKSQELEAEIEPEELLLKIVLIITQALFDCRETLPERTYENALENGKRMLVRSQRDTATRSVKPTPYRAGHVLYDLVTDMSKGTNSAEVSGCGRRSPKFSSGQYQCLKNNLLLRVTLQVQIIVTDPPRI